MKKQLADFNSYMPAYNLKNTEDIQSITKGIKETIQKKLKENLVQIDNTFAIENFEYATKELGNDTIENIYSLLGPFDFSQYTPEEKVQSK